VAEMIQMGQILIEQGVLSEQQVFEIIERQRQEGEPFGVIAERMFDVTLETIEQAWTEQYHRFTGTIDLSDQTVDEETLGLITRRQAWQFEMMPLGFEPTGELLVAASRQRLTRAVTFVINRFNPLVYFRIAEPDQLRLYLKKYYPMPEISQDTKDRVREMAWDPHQAP